MILATGRGPSHMCLDAIGLCGIGTLQKCGNFTTNETEIAVGKHPTRFATDVLCECGDCMFEGGSGEIAKWVFEEVASFNVDKEKGITVSANSGTSAIHNAIVEHIPEKGWGRARSFVPATFRESGNLAIVPNRIASYIGKGDVGLREVFGCKYLSDVVEAYAFLEQFRAV